MKLNVKIDSRSKEAVYGDQLLSENIIRLEYIFDKE